MKYTKINVSSDKEFEKDMTEFGERMAEFGAKMASFGSKVSNNIFDIFDESEYMRQNETSYTHQNGTSTIIKDNKTIINTFDGNEIVLENGEIFLNGKKMKVDDDLSKESEQAPSNDFEKKLKKHEMWLIFMMIMMGIICLTLLFQF